MSTSPQSAFVLTGLYVAVHLINALAADVSISAALIQGSEGQIAVEPLVRRDDVVRLDASWYSGRRCARPTRDMTVRVGGTVLRLPREEVSELVLDTGIVREQNGSGVIRIAGTAGCPENPLVGSAVTLSSHGRNVEGMMLWASPAAPRQVSDVNRRLAGTRSQSDCETQGDLRSCPVESFGPERVRILFSERAQTMPSGLPLHAVCTAAPGGNTCEITESQSTGLGYRAFLRRAADSADLAAAESEVQARLANYTRAAVAQTAEAGL